jgi:hypothetical protein
MIRISYTTLSMLGLYGDFQALRLKKEWLSLTKYSAPPRAILMGWWDSKTERLGIGIQLDRV